MTKANDELVEYVGTLHQLMEVCDRHHQPLWWRITHPLKKWRIDEHTVL